MQEEKNPTVYAFCTHTLVNWSQVSENPHGKAVNDALTFDFPTRRSARKWTTDYWKRPTVDAPQHREEGRVRLRTRLLKIPLIQSSPGLCINHQPRTENEGGRQIEPPLG